MATVRRTSNSKTKEVTRELVSAWEQRYPVLKKLNDATLDKNRGELIPKAELVTLAGSEKEFNRVKEKWADSIVWLRGIKLAYDHANKGYRFITTEEHLVDRFSRVMKSSEKKHRNEALWLGLIRDADFENDHQRKLRVLQMQQHTDTKGKIEAQREHMRIALAQPETLPRIVGNGRG